LLIYPVHLEPDDNGTILATFPGVPEAVTYGDDAADAVNHAVGSLTAMFSANMDDRQRIPMPSALKGSLGVILPVGVSAKILI
jgi:antitoxin HicB